MTDLNSVAIIGRLTKDCTVKTFDGGSSIINITIAVNYSKKGQDGNWTDEASFFDVRYSTKSTKIANFLVKGAQVAVNGSLRQEKWQKDGQTNSRVVIRANDIQLVGGKGNGGNSGSQSGIPQEAQDLANAFDGSAFPEDDFPGF